ncbi:MAG: manganese efflux pump MntP family protein [Erysipelotrichales bacterium]
MLEIFLIAIGLSMDAVAVALSIGCYTCSTSRKLHLKVGLTFGFFQAVMPLVGFLLAYSFRSYIESLDHWLALILLSYLGFNMLWAGYKNNIELFDPTTNKALIVNGIATSIDALVIGIMVASLNGPILTYMIIIGLTTFILSYIGIKAGCGVGIRYSKYSLYIGGVILILMGIKIFLEHTVFV